nr:MAG TPA: Protein of unknown function (DUF2718) [Caudoviricetes sp.]
MISYRSKLFLFTFYVSRMCSGTATFFIYSQYNHLLKIEL